MADWFRNSDWNEEIAVGFEARLARARDKAQYLNIQAHTLLATHPGAAAELCRRAIALDDPDQAARAGLYLGTALALQGRFDQAIAALEAAIEAERVQPMVRTGAFLDQALLVAWTRRSDLYETVIRRLDRKHPVSLGEQPLSALIARALIASQSDMAAEALAELEEFGAGHGLSAHLPLSELRQRLREAAG